MRGIILKKITRPQLFRTMTDRIGVIKYNMHVPLTYGTGGNARFDCWSSVQHQSSIQQRFTARPTMSFPLFFRTSPAKR